MVTKNTLHIIFINFFSKSLLTFYCFFSVFYITKMLLIFTEFFLSIFVFEKIVSQPWNKWFRIQRWGFFFGSKWWQNAPPKVSRILGRKICGNFCQKNYRIFCDLKFYSPWGGGQSHLLLPEKKPHLWIRNHILKYIYQSNSFITLP